MDIARRNSLGFIFKRLLQKAWRCPCTVLCRQGPETLCSATLGRLWDLGCVHIQSGWIQCTSLLNYQIWPQYDEMVKGFIVTRHDNNVTGVIFINRTMLYCLTWQETWNQLNRFLQNTKNTLIVAATHYEDEIWKPSREVDGSSQSRCTADVWHLDLFSNDFCINWEDVPVPY